ncbi:MAG: lytic transglycosylase domain-containing protein [Leptonema sp. (in: bacteria)]
MAKIKLWKSFLTLSLFPLSLIHPLEIEIFQLFKASQWKPIIDFFKKSNPITLEQHYLYAKALEKEKINENYIEIIRIYLLTAGIKCSENDTELTICLRNYRNVNGIISNLALLKAQSIAENNKNFTLQYEILKKGDYNQEDQITKLLYQKYLEWVCSNYSNLEEEEIKKAMAFYNQKLQSSKINFYLAKIYEMQNKIDAYYENLFLSAMNSKSETHLKIISNELKKNLDSIPKKYIRYLTIFYFDKNIHQLLKNFSQEQLIQTTNSSLLYYDGKYFINTKDENSLMKLASKGYSYLSQKPKILLLWIQDLYNKKQYYEIEKLIRRFEHTKTANLEIWKFYLLSLREIGKVKSNYRDHYFNEILSFLKNFSYDTQVQDLLLEFLLIKNNDSNGYTFEEKKYWDIAYSKMPQQTESGRFFYWLYRYYTEHLKNPKLAKFIAENFYYFAPGSYYVYFFWQEIQKYHQSNNYQKEWETVNSQLSFYQWIMKYGNQEEALRFLSTKNLKNFYQKKAVELQNNLKEDALIPYEILFLFKFGEYEYGFSLFDDIYKDQTTFQYYKFLTITGKKSNNLFIQVRSLRELFRGLQISEDPFTLPPFLLENLYPRPYRNIVQNSSKRWNLEEDIIYALMRQESMFREDAISRSGAIGLLQIMPKTGVWLAEKLKRENYNLFKPDDSIDLGAKFFSDLLRSYGNDFHWAAIAYNGGPGNLRKWKNKYYTGDFFYFLEILPSEESRNYVRKTYQNYLNYKISHRLYDYGIR